MLKKINSSQALLLILLVIGLAGSIINGAAIYNRLTYLAVLTLGGAWLWARVSLRGLTVQRKMRNLRASVGDIFEETVEVHNSSRLPHAWVQVLNQSNLHQAAGSRFLTLIGGRQMRSYLARTWLLRRGAFQLGPTLLRGGDPLGLFTREQSFASEESLLVLPLVVPIQNFPSPVGLLPGGRAIRVKSQEITPHAGGVREYAHGDPLKRIHWPSTARRGRMMVKEFEQDPQAEVWLMVDAQRAVQAELKTEQTNAWRDWMFSSRPELSLAPSTLEYSIAIAASVTNYLLRQRRAVGFVAASPHYTVLPADHSDRQLLKILETLAFANGEGKLPLLSLVEAQASQLPLGASVVLITPTTHAESLLLALDNLQRRNLRPVVILIDSFSFGGQSGSTELIKKVEELNIPVCLIAYEDDISEKLSSMTSQTFIKEPIAWHSQTTPSLLT